ncbi:granzyme A-like [Nematolebias whitei]|uniref:granzyme A-like n=1 Tax=Nematolebias whitei TaxID=451745 RepID=UPI00189BF2EF|nr:granzyme A-like [Nematolebias whitei]
MFSLSASVAVLSWTFLLFVNLSHGSEIINGNEVKPHSMPFMALLMTDAPNCGGTLIDPKWVLTAAHCTDTETVLLGLHSIENDEEENHYRQVLKVKRSIPHPYYAECAFLNDLMLLELDEAVKETKWVKALRLNNNVKDPEGGSVCVVAGWGTTAYNEEGMSDVLMSVNVTVMDREKCSSAQFYGCSHKIYPNMICAGSDGDKVADTCQGDSGGPIICDGALVGVTSFGESCGIKHKPGVYAFLTGIQLDWIKETMKMAEI